MGVDRSKYKIHIPLPPKIDPTVTMMQVQVYFYCVMLLSFMQGSKGIRQKPMN